MKLLREFVSVDKLEILSEETEKTKEKYYRVKGPFMEATTRNRNGRVYSQEILEREVKKYNEECISKGRSLSELDHPDSPNINLERVSHIIEELKMEGNIGYGVARFIDTPMGRIAQTLIKEGVILGMSTRGVGSLEGENVKDDYSLIAIDAVFSPSAPSAFVEGVLENKEYIIGKDGEIVETAIRNLQKEVDEKYSGKSKSQLVLRYMMNFINEIRSKNF